MDGAAAVSFGTAGASMGGGGGAAGEAPPPSKLFLLGRHVAPGSLRRDFQDCCVPDGFVYAADSESFGNGRAHRPLTAASTAHADRSTREKPESQSRVVESEAEGIWIARLTARPEGGAPFVAFEMPAAEGIHEGSEPAVIEHEEHGACIRLGGASSGAGRGADDGAQAGLMFRLSDGAPVSASPFTFSVSACVSSTARLKLVDLVLISGAIYVRVRQPSA